MISDIVSDLVSYSRAPSGSPFLHRPYMNNSIAQHSVSYLPEPQHRDLDYQPVARSIVIKESFVSNED